MDIKPTSPNGPNRGIDPARLREIGERIANSYSDQPEVIDQVAQRIARDPGFTG